MSTPGNWHEDDELWRSMQSFIFDEDRMAMAIAEVDALVGLLGLKPGARVLDLCCGVGRHALEFARRGYSVTGVDRTSEFLDEAQRQAKAQGLQIDWVESDVREYSGEGFDAVINMYTSFGYFEDPEDDLRLANVACRALKPGGRFHVQALGKEIIASKYRPRHWEETAPGVFWLEEALVTEGFSHTDTRWLHIKDGEVRETRFRVRMYSGLELHALLLQAGFESATLYGDLDARPYDREARRLHAVARRG